MAVEPQRHISLPKPFNSGDANEWFKRFEICCKANGWDDAKKSLKLPTLLEGEALDVWLELTEEQQETYATAKKEISTALMPMHGVRVPRRIPPTQVATWRSTIRICACSEEVA